MRGLLAGEDGGLECSLGGCLVGWGWREWWGGRWRQVVVKGQVGEGWVRVEEVREGRLIAVPGLDLDSGWRVPRWAGLRRGTATRGGGCTSDWHVGGERTEWMGAGNVMVGRSQALNQM